MKKGTDNFKKIISDHLQVVASNDELFAKNLAKENKSIDECVQYIFQQVQESGANGFADDEIFGMAIHYYDEDTIKVDGERTPKVIVNHHVEITEEEKAEAKAKAIAEIVSDEKSRAMKKKSLAVKPKEETNPVQQQQQLF